MIEVRAARGEEVTRLEELAAAVPEAPRWGAGVLAAMVASRDGGAEAGAVWAGVLVAVVDGLVAGFVGVRRAMVEGEPAEVETLVVERERRRQGIATALLRAAMAWCVAAGGRALLLEVRLGNVAARMLYARAGFETVAVRKGYYEGPREDAVVMQRLVRGGLEPHGTLE